MCQPYIESATALSDYVIVLMASEKSERGTFKGVPMEIVVYSKCAFEAQASLHMLFDSTYIVCHLKLGLVMSF